MNLNFQLSMVTGLKMQVIQNTNSSQPSISGGKVIDRKQICNLSDPKFDFCDVEGDVRIHGKSSKIFAVFSQMGDLVGNESWNIRPYPRERDPWMMITFIEEFLVNATVSIEEAPPCSLNHRIPAVYQPTLKQLSMYEIVNIDTDNKVHCFLDMIVGLKHYMELRIDPMTVSIGIDPMTASIGYSMKEFMKLIRTAYSLKKSIAIKILHDTQEKPRLLILTRNNTRKF
ncbi:hypothetical protein NE237_005839 [Protea cynaroides]|uniref:Uncharacterized protein n=1 Tax=Protea cynaroides TaxID=273540 RepID=A0A9Q0KLH6_9MAGN|nr:hypothetical protein NE237_005839 [Protea cynaroides]